MATTSTAMSPTVRSWVTLRSKGGRVTRSLIRQRLILSLGLSRTQQRVLWSAARGHFREKYFHWITHKALKELSAENSVITSELRTTTSGSKLRLYWAKRNRYWKRAANQIVSLVEAHSDPDLTKAIGHHAESLFAIEAARAHFRILGKETREFNGKLWPLTEHDLDWIIERDGVGWGVELKNTWAYIDRAEMDVKVRLCSYLGLKPLFIMRWAPKSYIEIIRKAGGFGLLFEQQRSLWGTVPRWNN